VNQTSMNGVISMLLFPLHQIAEIFHA